MYPHTLTGVFASASGDTIRKNAMLLPAYRLLLGLVALLGYVGHAAGLKLSNNNDVVPLLFKTLFPGCSPASPSLPSRSAPWFPPQS
jgi:solute:Na+ symporter, SSS family